MLALLAVGAVAVFSTPQAFATSTTTTTLAVSPASPQTGGTVQTLTATVTSGGTAVHPGTVNFYDFTSAYNTNSSSTYTARPQLIGTAQLGTGGTAAIKRMLGAGLTHTLKAVFVGTTSYATSTSATVTDVISGGNHDPLTLTTSANLNTGIGNPPYSHDFIMAFNFFGPTLPDGTMIVTDTTDSSNTSFPAATTNLNRQGGGFLVSNFTANAKTTAAGPRWVAVGDFNNDGKLDMVVTNATGANVSVYLGNGDGTFGSEVTYATGGAGGSAPSGALASVAVGDFNNDGKQDIIVSNTSTSNVSLLLGNGDGTFQTHSDFTTTVDPTKIVIGDFNEDGNLDIAVGTGTGYGTTVNILLGTGGGGFTTGTSLTVGTGSAGGFTDMVVGDFNNDGHQDLITDGYSGESFIVWKGNGDGTFTQVYAGYPPQPNLPWGMATADINGDGIPDICLAFPGTNGARVYCATGTGVFGTQSANTLPFQHTITYGLAGGNTATNSTTPRYIALADVDGDGWPDLIGTDYQTGTLYVAQNYPALSSSTAPTSGSYTGQYFGFLNYTLSTTTSSSPDVVAVGDFFGTGLPAMAVATEAGSVNIFQVGQSNQAAIGSPYFGEAGIYLTSSVQLGTNAFTARYYPGPPSNTTPPSASSSPSTDLYALEVSPSVNVPVYGSVAPVDTLSPGTTINYGQSATLTVTVPSLSLNGTPVVPTGTDSIYDCSYPSPNYYASGLTLNSSAQVTYTITHPNAGTYAYCNGYSGDTNYFSYGSVNSGNPEYEPNAIVLTVNKEVPTLSLAISPTTQLVQGLVTMTATVGVTANASAGIVVNFNLNGTTGTCTTNSSGVCSAQLAVPASGANSASATVVSTTNLASVTTNYSGSITGTMTTQVPTISSTHNPSSLGQSVTISATVPTVGGITPTGSVHFTDSNGNVYGQQYGSDPSLNGSGVASFTITNLVVGTTTFTAAYSGDITYNSATSAAYAQVVQAASTSVTLTAPSTVSQGTAATLSATVTSNGSALSPAVVLFYDTASSPQLLGAADVNSSGVATFKQVLGPGTHVITAVFGGLGPGHTGATSSAATTVVTGNGSAATTSSIALTGSPGSYVLFDTTAFSGRPGTGSVASFFDATNGNALLGTSGFSTFSAVTGNEVDYSVGSSPASFPISVAVGDVNGDGILDLVVANYNDGNTSGGSQYNGGSISVLLGNGNGTFQTQSTVSAIGPNQVKLADLNADGYLDILYVNDFNNIVCSILGNGNGTFSSSFQCANTFGNAYAMAIADFNKDGIPDVAVTNNGSYINYFNGNGDGTFGQYGSPTTNVQAGNGATAIAAGDFNGDGNPDFVVTNSGDGTIQVFLGDGTGNFTGQTAQNVGNYPNAIVVGDFNGDGKKDIAFTNQTDHTVGVMLGNGDGTFQTMVTYAAGVVGPGAISLVDINGDGKDDLVVANTQTIEAYGGNGLNNGGNLYDNIDSDFNIGVYLSHGDGTFAARTTPITTSGVSLPYMVAVGDFNGDGVPDLAIPFAQSGQVAVYLDKETASAAISGTPVNNAGPVLVKSGYTHVSGDAFATSVSSTVQLQGYELPVITSSSNPVTAGTSVMLTITLSALGGSTPTGTVQLKDGSANLGSPLTLSSGVATYSTSSLTQGTHAITAVYSGNSQFVTTTSVAFSQVVSQAGTSVTLTSSGNPVAYGTSVTFTATLGVSNATGTVTFSDGSTVLGSGTVTSGVATYSTSALTVGSHSITAAYTGNNPSGTSSTLTQTISLSSAATTTLTSSANPSVYGNNVMFTATLGSSSATGTVNFLDGSTVIASNVAVSAGVATFSTSSLSVTTHSITAVYSGNSNYATSTSAAVSQVVTQATPTIAAPTYSPSGGAYGTSITITQTVPTGVTGTISFYAGSTLLGTGTVSGGVATFTTTAIPAGTVNLATQFGGNANYAAATSASTPITITQATPTLAAPTASPTGGTYGTSITLTQTVPTGVTGNISFYAGSTYLGTGTVSGGVATLTTTAIPLGSNSITTQFSGNSNFTSATSATGSVTITGIPTTTTLGASPSSGAYGTSIVLTANVTYNSGTAVPSGTVNFYVGSTLLGTGTVTSGAASITTTVLPVTANSLTATFVASGNYATSSSSTATVTISQATPVLAAPTASPTTAPAGTSVTFTQAVPAGVTGTISFYSGSTLLGTGTVSGGVATFTTSSLAAGINSITTQFGGNSNYTSASSSVLHFTVTPAAASIALAVTTGGTQTSSVASGTAVTLTATVIANSAAVTPGVVYFCDATASYCTDLHRIGMAQLTTAGTASISITPALGSHSYKAIFLGTTSAGPNTSTTKPLAVTGTVSNATTTTLTSTGSIGNYSLTATVTGSASTGPGGTITFFDTTNANASIASAPLGASTAGATANTSATLTAGSQAYASAVGDFNNDGIPDVVVANRGTDSVTLYLGNGNGTYGAGNSFSTGSGSAPFAIATGDFNGDGNLDIVTADYGSSQVTVLRGNGSGAFPSTSVYSVGANPASVAVGDFNGDGILDLAVANQNSTSVSILIGASNGSFNAGTAISLGATPLAIATADLDGDGILDLAIAGVSASQVLLYQGNGDGTFTAKTPVSTGTGSGPDGIALGDFNGDGKPDIVTSNNVNSTATVLLNGGAWTFTISATPTVASFGQGVAIGDFNGDGILDFVTTGEDSSAHSIVTFEFGIGGGAFTAGPSAATGLDDVGIAAGDLNGDGVSDVVTANYGGANATVVLLSPVQTAIATASHVAVAGTGTHVVDANFPGDSYNAASTSNTVNLTAGPLPTVMTLGANPTSGAYGTSVTLTATLSPYSAQGYSTDGQTVTFSNGSTILGTGTLTGGVATFTTTALPVAANSITASFAGTADFAAVTTSATTVTITQATLTLTVPTLSPTSGPSGTSVTITQSFPAGANGTTVTFYAGSTLLGTGTVSNGVATLTTTAIPVGTNSITTSFPGNSNYAATTSPAATITISGISTLLTLNASPSPSSYGTSVQIVATVTAGSNAAPTVGSVIFIAVNGTTPTTLGTVAVGSAGTATLTTSALPVGALIISAQYLGSGNYASSAVATTPLTVTQSATTLSAPTASPTGGPYGTSITITQAVPSGVTGTITFYNGSTVLGTGTIANGVATFTTTALPVGPNSITASFPGNGNYAAATSAATTITISPVPTSTSISASPTSAAYGTPVVLTVLVIYNTGGNGFASLSSGNVTFYNGSTSLGTAAIGNGNTAVLTTSALPVGTNSISAIFAATGNYAASATTTSATVTISQGTPTLSAPTASPTNAAYGTSITLTQTVPSGVTGTLSFYNGSTLLGTGTIVNGVATLTTTALPGGTNSITTSFPGNANYAAATSAAATITITPAATSLSAPTASPTNAPYGTSITLTQTVPSGVTGTLSFYNGSTLLGTGTIVNGVATLTTTALPGGTNSITTSFPGNSNYAAGTSVATSITITPATLTLSAPSASPTSGPVGTSVTLSQTFPAGATGTVTFYNGTTAIGTATIVNGVATLTTTALPAGANSITASYPGNANYAATTSPATTVTLASTITPGYTISANPSTLTIHAGSSGTSTLTFTPVGGFAGTFNLACNQLPPNATCQFMQNGVVNNVVVMTGNNQPIQVGLTVLTDVPTASLSRPSFRGSSRPALGLMLPCGLAALLFSLRRRRKTLPRLLALLLLAAATGSSLVGCAGGGFGTTATPLGTSVVIVTATATAQGSNSTSQTFNMTVTIIQ